MTKRVQTLLAATVVAVALVASVPHRAFAQVLGLGYNAVINTIKLAKTTNQIITGASTNLTTVNFPASSGAVTLTMPNTADTMVGRATTDTLTNKTLTSPILTGPSSNTYAATATTNQLLLGTTNVTTYNAASPAGSVTVDLPNTAGGVASSATCGTTTTCSAAAATVNMQERWGTVALSSASPSVATVTTLTFTSNTSYVCSVTPEGTTAAIAAGGIAVSRTNGTTVVFTGPNTVTTIVHYRCTGI